MSENQQHNDDQPNVNQNQEQSQNPQARGYISNDMADFSYLIGLVMDYYYAKEPAEEGEEWKREMREELIDEEVDAAVRDTFISKLKKHQ